MQGIDNGQTFYDSASGRWAGERFLAALNEGRPITPAELRTLDTLRHEEWIHFDNVLIEEGQIRLRGIADIMGAGLTIPVPNAMGKTVVQYEKATDMEPAILSLDPNVRSKKDRVEFVPGQIPMPVIHKDFDLNIRTLAASRTTGEPLDTMQARVAARLCSERLEALLFQGTTATFGNLPIYGYITHPDRNTSAFGTNGSWDETAKTGENILDDVLTMKAALHVDRFYGPYWIYAPADAATKLDDDFKANSDKTIKQRIMEVDGVQNVQVADQLPTDHVIMVQATQDVTALLDGEGLQTIQWDINGGMTVAFKAFMIQVPLIRSDVEKRSGLFDMTG
jgi:uncharacterized linocin/CFP29 family protein